MKITLSRPKNFDFKRTVISHGWCELLPYELDRATWSLTRVIDVGREAPVTVVLTSTKRALRLETSRALKKEALARMLRDVRHMLRLDDDMSNFYRIMNAHEEFAWIARQG